SYLVAEDNQIAGIFRELPEKYADVPVSDYGDRLIIPGLCDMHVHAPQFVYRGLGLDLQLMDWLNKYAFPTEARFADENYARIYYKAFADEMAKSGTTRAVVFGTLHVPATEILMEELNERGVAAFVGKVNMDTLSPDYLCETAEQSLLDTERWIVETADRYPLVRPAITPRFIPTCSTEVLEGLGRLAEKYKVSVHSHISEDLGEMSVVRERYPDIPTDGEVYDRFGLLGGRTVMAHFLYSTKEEMELVAGRGVTIVHCPQSHGNVAAGFSPLRKMLKAGVKVALGSDIAGGCSIGILRAMSDAIYMSKLQWLLSGKQDMFLSVAEAFYLGTMGGGQFFGKVGCFEPGYEFDAVVIDDASLNVPADRLTLEERVERVIHLGDDRNVIGRYVAGVKR
ncbi:MAG: amidohydrolase family protein, partial [Lachnospiraceae bacterium]|nr:amidohydrolase family protein [Lachnospiraceae bacterium]